MENKWICRSVLEITLLILRCQEKEKASGQSSNIDRRSPLIKQEEQLLRNFLDILQKENIWSAKKKQKNVPRITPCVPQVVCFDETSQVIGATRPSWEIKKDCWNPWIFNDKTDFFTKSRDARIPQEIRKHHFQPANEKFDTMTQFSNVFAYAKDDLGVRERRRELRAQFRRECFGPLRRYELHVWQAIDGMTGNFKAPCVRCGTLWNAHLLQTDMTDQRSTDTYSSERETGACAEHCLHAELILRELRKRL